MDSNLKAFLNLIRVCEGTAGDNGWRLRHNGNKSTGVLFTDMSRHPCIVVKETNSSAAGAFQITCSTWKALQALLNLPDFSPASQIKAAIQLLKWRRAYDDVLAGRFETAIQKCRSEWTSLPGAKQQKKTLAEARSIYQSEGGALAA